jgi:hypothetical protein|tara:strand:+ start:494 stop:772 length:279 start_codon:yes stop_codon:yes gene_type:complete
MKLTKSKLKQLIKEELALMGALETENNFVKKHDLDEELSPKDEKLNKLNDAKVMLFDVMKAAQEAEQYDVARALEDAVGALQKAISKIYYAP